MKVEEQFEAISTETLDKARHVRCSQEDYLEGLKGMQEDLLTEIQIVTEEIENKGG